MDITAAAATAAEITAHNNPEAPADKIREAYMEAARIIAAQAAGWAAEKIAQHIEWTAAAIFDRATRRTR